MIQVIIDGPDRCYKSTTCALIKAQFALEGRDVPIYRAPELKTAFLSPEKRNQLLIERLRHATTTEVNMLEQIGFDVIFDRHYPSEYVYSQYYKRDTDRLVLEDIDTRLTVLGAKIVILRRAQYDGVKDDLDPKIDLKKIDQFYGGFTVWSSAKDIMTLFVDTMPEENRIKLIMNFIKG